MNANQLTQKSIEAIQAAQSLCTEYNHTQLEQVHLLYALINDSDDLNAQLFTSMGVNVEQLKKELTRKMAADLLKKGRTSVRGMWSEKKGVTYDAAVLLDDTGEKYVHYKLEFQKKQ